MRRLGWSVPTAGRGPVAAGKCDRATGTVLANDERLAAPWSKGLMNPGPSGGSPLSWLHEDHAAVDHDGLACHVIGVRGSEEERRAHHVLRDTFATDQVRSGKRLEGLARAG